MNTQKNSNSGPPLWTRDFTILTLGSVVSMLGNSMSGFAMSLLVLDYTQSAMLYAIYIAVFTLPQVIMPVFSGVILDRFSRKRTIYTLDFLSAGMYAAAAVLLGSGWFSFPAFACYCFLVGSINSIYMVAYQSFYPLLITEGNYSKAYSVSSTLETLTALMIPVSTFAYNQVGIAPLMAINAVCFYAAAVVETRIQADEKYLVSRTLEGSATGRQLLKDMKEGVQYLISERGLLAIAIYFSVSSMAGGASQVITLPFFKGNYDNGEYIYMLVWGMAVIGRALGGIVHYRIKLPAARKFTIAFIVYICVDLFEGFYLYFPIPLMMVICFCTGILGVTSYTIRISATQSYVPDDKKGRFNGAFNMLNTTGSLTGELLAGALAMVLPVRGVLAGFMLVTAVAAVILIGGNRRHVKEIYNRNQ